MSVLAPPEPPAAGHPKTPELLIREARERQRRRRSRAALVLGVLGAAAADGVRDRPRRRAAAPPPRSRRSTPVVDARAFAGHGRLAFVSRGRLWVLDGTAGKLVRVAGPGAGDPVFSPDGRRLLYGFGKRFGLARADGTGPRLRPGGATWLPDGRLLLSRNRIERVADDGSLVPDGRAPAGLVAWAPDGSRWVFDKTRIVHDKGGAFHGVELLQVAGSLTGPRTTWYRLPQRFTPKTGWESPGIGWTVVLPRRRGILIWLDPVHSNSIAADGLPVYELTAAGAKPRKLGTTVGGPGVSLVPDGPLRARRRRRPDRLGDEDGADSCRAARLHARPLGRRAHPRSGALARRSHGRLRRCRERGHDDVASSRRSLKRWYATPPALARKRASSPDSTGAAAPAWSSDGRSLLFVKDDALWLLPSLDAKPVRVAGPLFAPGVWPNSNGQVPWSAQFAWHS